MKEQRFLRSKRLRAALWLSTDGKCAICRSELKDGWHADHVVPWSETHKTNVHEMQPLCPACNLIKGNKTMKYRKHQAALREFSAGIASDMLPLDILGAVVPGGGKSMLPGILAQALPSFNLAWFVPRLSLRHQAAEGLQRHMGIAIREAENCDIDPSRGTRGFVATHASLTMNPHLWAAELRRKRYILVIDEGHHAKVDHDGTFSPLARAIDMLEYQVRLIMTGTLETNDNKFIYGVPYAESDSGYTPDIDAVNGHAIRYTRADALAEGAVVPVAFRFHRGNVQWQESDGVRKTDISSASRADESKALYTALRTDFATELLSDCVGHYKENGDKLLVVTARQDDARKYQKELRGMGIESVLAITDEADAHQNIKKFRNGEVRCLVTCQMAYEGLDVPQITHIACLTHIRSTPWIEQMLARAWRAAPGKSQCWAFVPEDPKMLRVVERIRSEQPAEITMPGEGLGPGGEVELDPIVPIDGSVEAALWAYLDGEVEPDAINAKVVQFLADLGIDSDSEAAKQIRSIVDAAIERNKPTETVRERESKIRKQIAKACNEANAARAKRLRRDPDGEWGHYQKKLKAATKKSIKHMTIKELEHARSILPRILAR